MPRDGCRECLYRRIRCDKTDPSCQKCIKKGIECSGVGKFCFVAGVTRRRRKTAAPTASKVSSNAVLENAASESPESHADNSLSDANNPNRLAFEHEPSKSTPQQSGQQQLSLLPGKSSGPSGLLPQTYQQCNVRTDLALEGLKPGISELLMNCKLWPYLLLVRRSAF